MCNLYRLNTAADAIVAVAGALTFPDGIPNFEPRDVRITDAAPIIRPGGGGALELVQRRWSWPGQGGKPVYNFRSDNREFGGGRCLIVANGFYEFTAPADPKQKRKDRWLFTKPDEPLFAIAGLWRDTPVGEAFTMLTTEPGPDVARYHSRQVALLRRDQWQHWLDPDAPVKGMIGPLPEGTLHVEPSQAASAPGPRDQTLPLAGFGIG